MLFRHTTWIHLDSVGFLWIPWGSFGFPLAPLGFSWAPLDSPWLPLDSFGFRTACFRRAEPNYTPPAVGMYS